MASNDYDKLKDMYRREGQAEQDRRFRAMMGTPGTPEAPTAPGPMEGLEPSPIMEASIAKDKADRAAASDRFVAASRAKDTAQFGPKGDSGYGEISPDSFLGKYDIYPYEGEFSILKTLEDRGHVTLSPELKRDIAKVQRTEARAHAAYSDLDKLRKSQEVGVYRPTDEGKYTQSGTYDPYRKK